MREKVTRREALRIVAGAAIGSGIGIRAPRTDAAAETAGSDDRPWFRRHIVGIEWGPTGANDRDEIYMSRASGRDIIAALARARSEYAVVFMKDMNFAYYPSRVATRCPNLRGRDLLRECIDAAKPIGMPVIAYCQVQYDTATWNAHPEWRMKDAAGEDLGSRLCYRSGYLAFVEAVAAEMMEYEIAGFHFDMLDFGFGPPYGCWCPTCRAAFKKEHGIEMPAGVTWDEAWEKMLRFRCESNGRFCEDLEAFVKAKRPEISVDYNYHGYPPFNWVEGEMPVRHARTGDFVTAEGLPFVFGHTNPSLLALFLRAARPEGPIQCVTSRSVYDYHDFTVRPVLDLGWEVFTYLAHGAQCTIVDKANYEGTIDPVVYDRIGTIFAEALSKRDFFGHEPVREVGLYFSARARDWYAREEPVKYFGAVWGAHKALVHSHIPVGFVIDESASLERLRAFPIIYAPNLAVVTAEEIGLLRAYVADGGKLLLTGLAGACDRHGNLKERSSLEELIGARLVRTFVAENDNYLRLPRTLGDGEGKFLLEGIPPDWPMLAWGPIAVFEARGARTFGEILAAHRTEDNLWMRRMSAGKVAGPAVLVHRFGKGLVVCVPCAFDAAYAGDYRMPEHRILIRNLIRLLNPAPEVVVDAPLNVETVIARDAKRGRHLIHFLCFAGPPTSAGVPFAQGRRVLPPLMEEMTPYRARVRARGSIRKAEAAGAGARIRISDRDVEIEIAGVHEVLAIEM
ncbi:MAG: beta-galactosidase trimerization domain-containing protein [Planctomycetes bacterium]|nr:beta-galactosidase trimerization domain-containing protein [Planctomycetota bacterium]